jgi:hypothetical protein
MKRCPKRGEDLQFEDVMRMFRVSTTRAEEAAEAKKNISDNEFDDNDHEFDDNEEDDQDYPDLLPYL